MFPVPSIYRSNTESLKHTNQTKPYVIQTVIINKSTQAITPTQHNFYSPNIPEYLSLNQKKAVHRCSSCMTKFLKEKPDLVYYYSVLNNNRAFYYGNSHKILNKLLVLKIRIHGLLFLIFDGKCYADKYFFFMYRHH